IHIIVTSHFPSPFLLPLLSHILLRASGLRLLPLVCAHQMSSGQNVTYHCKSDVFPMRPALKLKFSVQRIESEEIPMRAVSGRWGGTSVADALKIIPALDRAINESIFRRHTFWQFGGRRRKIVENPMGEHARKRVGVFTNQHETLCVWRDVAPP